MILRLTIKGIKTPKFRQRINERLGLISKIKTPVIWVPNKAKTVVSQNLLLSDFSHITLLFQYIFPYTAILSI